jgi:hypothetical protein
MRECLDVTTKLPGEEGWVRRIARVPRSPTGRPWHWARWVAARLRLLCHHQEETIANLFPRLAGQVMNYIDTRVVRIAGADD